MSASYTVIHTRPRNALDLQRNVWFRASHRQLHENPEAFIERGARLGINTLSVPIVDLDLDLVKLARMAYKRDILLVGRVDADFHSDEEILDALEYWKAVSSIGIGLDAGYTTEPSAMFSRLAGMATQVGIDDGFLSVGLITNDGGPFTPPVPKGFIPVARLPYMKDPLTPENITDLLHESFGFFNGSGMVPSWMITNSSINAAAGRLSDAGVALIFLALPGIANFEQGVISRSPSTRHTLRLRQSANLPQGNLAVDDSRAGQGIVSLFNKNIEVMINFGWDNVEIHRQRVVMSSRIELPSADDEQHLILPPGDVVWLTV
ncbi:hypothetical protein J2S49_000301 [Arcanobacterium wilhelmae]|uniref:Uncharacterized protein n=1 Tax=Arcanobacterium wilhelmae TaxID=1803177 RepID=A0ABT9N947_9ACTO|nr:hypothetical protein [Arcanobacterium wilhelmae]MDP9800225.1 hypothetical protein [Arcanobacterium wilhelmae]WFN89664.1 hypothetical protein P8A24_05510 [Arcanobacterium wilhelmae]